MTSDRRTLLYLEVPFGVLGAALIAAAALFAWRGIPRWIPPALIVRLGIASPLTGMMRSFVALASGDVPRAFHWHPLGPVVFAACAAAIVVAIVSWLRGHRVDAITRLVSRRSVWMAVSAAAALVWIRQIVVFR